MYFAKDRLGFTLIEILIAIVILGTGLLGMLGIILNSLKLSSSSNYRVIAEQQAYSIAEIVRANPSLLGFSSPSAVPASPYDCLSATGCAKADFLGANYKIWSDQLASLLPSGSGTICRDSDPALSAHAPASTSSGGITAWNCVGDTTSPYVVKICWNESRISATKPNLNADQTYFCTWTSI